MSEEMFIKTLKEGKWMGVGRPLLPPMPWQPIGATLKDEDLKCIYAYLQSLKPIHNEVPQPVPPDKIGEVLAKK
jgi:cytochrome c553